MKYRISILIVLLWNITEWLIFNAQLFRAKTWMIFSEEYIYNNLYMVGTYFHSENYIFFAGIIAIICIEYCLKFENEGIIIRYKSRNSFFKTRITTAVLIGIMFSISHCVVGFAGSNILFQKEYLYNSNNMMFYLCVMIMLTLYLLQIGMLYFILRDRLRKKNMAIMATVVITSFVYFICNYILPTNWTPVYDLVYLSHNTYANGINVIDFSLTIIRQIVITLLFMIAAIENFKKEDVMNIEK